jgi:hypothetical protein
MRRNLLNGDDFSADDAFSEDGLLNNELSETGELRGGRAFGETLVNLACRGTLVCLVMDENRVLLLLDS